FLSVSQWMSYSRQASRLLISPVSTRRRISAHWSMSAYTSVLPGCGCRWSSHGPQYGSARLCASRLLRRWSAAPAPHFYSGVCTKANRKNKLGIGWEGIEPPAGCETRGAARFYPCGVYVWMALSGKALPERLEIPCAIHLRHGGRSADN